MRRFRREPSEDSTWQAVYMDLITLVMVMFLILWVIQVGGEGVPIDTRNIIPFAKLSLKDSSFPDGGVVFQGDEEVKLRNYLKQSERELFTRLGFSEEEDAFYYITVHGHGSLTGSFEQNMQISLQRAQSVADSIKHAYKELGHESFPFRDKSKSDRFMISVCGHSYNFPIAELDPTLMGDLKKQQQSINRRVDVMYHRVPKKLMNLYFLKE
jgi:flagellar motor protein MotB